MLPNLRSANAPLNNYRTRACKRNAHNTFTLPILARTIYPHDRYNPLYNLRSVYIPKYFRSCQKKPPVRSASTEVTLVTGSKIGPLLLFAFPLPYGSVGSVPCYDVQVVFLPRTLRAWNRATNEYIANALILFSSTPHHHDSKHMWLQNLSRLGIQALEDSSISRWYCSTNSWSRGRARTQLRY
jgi:hypothetical protein